MPPAPLKGPRKCPREYPSPLGGHRYLTGLEAASCLLKGQLHPSGAMTRLRASSRICPRDLRGSPRGPILDSCSPRALGELCHFCRSSPTSPLPFREPAGLGGGGEGVSVGLGESEPALPFGPVAGSGAAPGNPRPEMGMTPACEFWSGLRRLGSKQPWKDPPFVCEQVPDGAGMCRRAVVVPPSSLEPWSPGALRGRSKVGSSTGFDRCQKRKRHPLAITGS